MDSADTCLRLRFLHYEHQGRGISRKGLSIPQTVGTWTHKGLEVTFGCYMGRDGEIPPDANSFSDRVADLACMVACKGYDAEVADRGFDQETLDNPEMPLGYIAAENRALIEANIRLFEKVCLREILEEYEVVSVEQERLTKPFNQRIGFQSKDDVLLRRRRTGGLVVFDFKTSYKWTEEVEEQLKVANQAISEQTGIELDLEEKVEGIKRVVLVKGSYSKSGSQWEGVKSYQNRLIHPYKLPDTTGLGVGAEYYLSNQWFCLEPHGDGRWKCPGPTPEKPNPWHYRDKSMKACNVWEEPMGVKGWIDEIWSREPAALNAMIARPMLQVRDEDEVRDWIEQRGAMEEDIRVKAEIVNKNFGDPRLWRSMLNQFFPQTGRKEGCVQYQSRCSMYAICHEGADLRTMGGGQYIWRIPHHQPESEKFNVTTK